jgi:hypothetical protein
MYSFATHFDLKPHVIQLLPSFHGLDLENPYSHVKNFKDICTTFKFQNFSEESVHLRLFPFSLHDRAKAWLNSNMPGSITSWDNLLTKFYNNFFLMSKVNECRKEISSFLQEEDEKVSESWETFKDMLIKCPPHGYEKWRRISEFDLRRSISDLRSVVRQLPAVGFFKLSGQIFSHPKEGRHLQSEGRYGAKDEIRCPH